MAMKFILMILLTFSLGVEAEWEKLTADEKMTVYIDRGSVRDMSGGRRAWLLSDYKRPPKVGPHPFISTKILEEFDCKGERFRTLSLTGYSEKMGNGKKVYRNDRPTHWHYISPGLTMGAIIKAVCQLNSK
jgi:hypothetical protein